MSKINKHVGFLHTHVINVGDTAKLPYPGRNEGHSTAEVDDDDDDENENDDRGSDRSNGVSYYSTDGSRDECEVVTARAGATDKEHSPGASSRLRLGSTLLEHHSQNDLDQEQASSRQVAGTLESGGRSLSAPSGVAHRRDRLTEQRIDEVVGSYNLSNLKLFRHELIKYVSDSPIRCHRQTSHSA